MCLFALGYALFGLNRHWHFGSSAYDLGIFDQAVWHFSRLETPASSITGMSTILGDHFYPIVAAFAPLYWIAPAAETLIVAQAVLFALSILPVFRFLRARLPFRPSVMLAAAYGCFWGLQAAAAFDVHEMAFAPLVIATLLLAMDRRRWGWFAAAAVLLVAIKEDLIPLLACVGAYLVAQGDTKKGVMLAASGLAAFLLIVVLVIPSLSDSGQYSVGSAYADVLRRPWTIPVMLVTPPVKLRTAFLWLAPFLFLPLRSPLGVLLVPFVLERFLSASPTHWGTAFHYSAPLAPLLAMSAGDGLERLARGRRTDAQRIRVVTGAAALSLLLSALLPGHQPLWMVLSPMTYRQTTVARTGYEVLTLVPPDASVAAQAAVVPHMSQRARVYMLVPNAPDTDFVVAAADLSPWPSASYAEIAGLVAERRQRGYTTMFERDGWVLLRRP